MVAMSGPCTEDLSTRLWYQFVASDRSGGSSWLLFMYESLCFVTQLIAFTLLLFITLYTLIVLNCWVRALKNDPARKNGDQKHDMSKSRHVSFDKGRGRNVDDGI